MRGFPAKLFELNGDPAAIHSSAQAWRSFSETALESSRQITALDTSEFIGPEADLFREGLSKEIPSHLRITGDAYSYVSTALTSFANTLSALQDEIRPVSHQARGLWEMRQQAENQHNQAQKAVHYQQTLGDESVEILHLTNKLTTTGSALTVAQRLWQECIDKAESIRSRMTAAVNECARCINEAAQSRFVENPSLFGRLASAVGDFLEDSVEALRFLSGALKVVSTIAGLLSFIPILAPITAPIALATAGVALAIDIGLYAATGEGSLAEIVTDAALLALPGIGKVLKEPLRQLVVEGYAIGQGIGVQATLDLC